MSATSSTHISVALVMPSYISALCIARSLATRGIRTICADHHKTFAARSTYADFLQLPDWTKPENEEETLLLLEQTAEGQQQKPVFFPAGDEAVLFLSKNRQRLARSFHFVIPDHDLLVKIINKGTMFELATENGLSAPHTFLPANSDDVEKIADQILYPCLLKSAYSHSPLAAINSKFLLVESRQELIRQYSKLSAVDPHLTITEHIPGPHQNINIYAAYWDKKGNPNMVFTGRMERKHEWGSGTMCSSNDNPELEELMNGFLKKINYHGIIDVGLKYDSRDSTYKVLDINPRIGQNFRTFVTTDTVDFPIAQILDLQDTPISNYTRQIGRRWIIEDEDFEVSVKQFHDDQLSLSEWFRSYRNFELTFFSLHDIMPWFARYREKLSFFPGWFFSSAGPPAILFNKTGKLFAKNTDRNE